MRERIVVTSEDLDLGIRYSLQLSRSQALRLLNAGIGESMTIGPDGWWIEVREKAIWVRQGSNPTLLEKADVFQKIEEALLEGSHR